MNEHKLHLLTLAIERTERGGIHYTFGGRGLSAEDIGAFVSALVARAPTLPESYFADASPCADTPSSDRYRS